MTLQTNLSRKPYFDDYTENSQYVRILHKPGVAVQTRELNQAQSILQDQINRFGRNIFKEGSIVEGCRITFDNKLAYVKLKDTFANGTAFTINDFQDQYIYNSNGLKAVIVNTLQGYESQSPNTNTLYIKYLNSVQYPNGAPQSVFGLENLRLATSANITIGNVYVTNVGINDYVGYGYSMTVTPGIIFKKGTFLYVSQQTVLVTPYSNQPDGLSVGFDALETIDTAQSNSALYDNAAGSPNYSAPGADRLKIVPSLTVRNTVDVTNTSSFFSIVDFKQGAAVSIRQDAEYSTIGREMARRTFETNGDFVVSPFVLTTKNLANTSDPDYLSHVNLITSRGLGYIEGYRVEYLNNNITKLRKATDFDSVNQQIVTTNFGNYVYATEFTGEFGDSTAVISVELHNVAKTSVTSGTLLSTSYSGTTKIGTAYVRGFQYDSGTPGTSEAYYRLYLFNIQMNPGQNFSDVKSIIYSNSGLKGVADVVTQYNAALNANAAVLQQTFNNGMVFPFGQRAIKTDGFDNTEFVYRRKGSSQFLTTSNASINIPSASGTGTEVFPYTGILSPSQASEFYVVPTADGQTANLTGTVSISTGNVAVIGSGTSFLSEYQVGDYVGSADPSDTAPKLITFIANNTYMNVASAWTSANATSKHYKVFPAGSPISFVNRPARYITINTPTTATVTLGDTPVAPFNVDVFYNVNRSGTVPIKKIINSNVYVKIKCSNNSAGFTGPWSLGLPDVVSIDGVWIGSGTNYSNSGVDYSKNFKLDNGQRDGHYDLSTISVITNSPADQLTANSTLTVKLTCFSYDQSAGKGFFTANSYPIDDTDPTNVNAITTAEIPLYTTSKGTTFDLRDVVDFRPFASNTATITTTLASATINPSATLSLSGNQYLPAPDSNFQTDLSYYLQRIDRASLDIGGNVIITEGIPAASNPLAPQEQRGTMTLGTINVPPYPSLSTEAAKTLNRYDYAITTSLSQNKRFTMKDIGALENRIENIEYYTSLSLLEQAASNLLVRSGTTGQNRFQNGIFVDPFKGFDLSNTIDPKYYIAMDPERSELRPAFVQMRSTFKFDETRSENTVKHGELIMLDHTSDNAYISQNYASKYRNCVEGNIFQWNGSVKLDPPGTLSPDITTAPTVTNNIDLATNWINLQNAWGTQWGNWVDQSSTATATLFNASSTSDITNADGSRNITTVDQTINNVSTKQQQIGTVLDVAPKTGTSYNLGKYVTNVSILPYLKAAALKYEVHGMKPNTRLYAYFGNVPVSGHCAPTNSSYTVGTGSQTNVYGDPIYTDNSGTAYGWFYLPANTFKAQDNVFELNDISDLTQGENAITTRATVTFYGSNLSIAQGESIINTREVVLQSHEVQADRTVTGLQLGERVTPEYIPPPPPSTGGGDDCGCGCFISSALITLASGQQIPIDQVKIGDKVFNHNKTKINTVKFIEQVSSKYFAKLFSPSADIAPFATPNHPLYINGELSAVEPNKNISWYPWLGKNKQIEVASIVDATEDLVYNLWVDGDGSYLVNGFGTTSIIGDGGLLRLAVEQGLMSKQKAVEMLYYYTEQGQATVYGVYLLNKLAGKINNKYLNKILVNMMVEENIGRKVLNSMFKIVGGAFSLAK